MAEVENNLATSAKRFSFGRNWRKFLRDIDAQSVDQAVNSLGGMLGAEAIRGKTFLDVGAGSGLFSLAALRLGADKVHGFDFDPDCVACVRDIHQRFAQKAENWTVEQGDVLDQDYVGQLGQWDVVYSWGVLHHSGDMWRALDNVSGLVAGRGCLFIAIYNDQGLVSTLWRGVKKLYVAAPSLVQWVMEITFFTAFATVLALADGVRGRNPLDRHRGLEARGMRLYRDVVDWIGGYPFEVAKPAEITDFFQDRGFQLSKIKTCGWKHGCNEFVFVKPGS